MAMNSTIQAGFTALAIPGMLQNTTNYEDTKEMLRRKCDNERFREL